MTQSPENTAPAADTRPMMALRGQYIKDLSFENPRAPASLFALQEAPTVEVAIDLGAQRLEEHLFEVSIHCAVRAVQDKTTVFLADLVYAGLLEVRNVPDAELEQLVYVQGAHLLFPFARRVVADVTRDGGFPSVQLEPINFFDLYAQQRARAMAAAPAAPEAAPALAEAPVSA